MTNPSGPQIEPSPAEKFFGLSARPFSLTPDVRFSYHSRSHTHALEQVTAALRRREGLIVVTGAVGTGKTMLCRSMLESFEPRTFLSVILDPGLDVEDLLRTVLTDFGLISGSDLSVDGAAVQITRNQFISTLQQFLASLIPLQAHAVIMIDEAQRLNERVLEELRVLSNFETPEAKLLQIVLVGQPELEDLLRKPEMQQLNQRVSRRCELQPLSATEVGDYIERRLTVAASPAALAGRTENDIANPSDVVSFAPDAVETIASVSRGIPRLVNTICDRALDVAFERKTKLVERDAVVAAADGLRMEVPGELVEPTSRRFSWLIAILVVLLLVLAATWWWLPKPPGLITPSGRQPQARPTSSSMPGEARPVPAADSVSSPTTTEPTPQTPPLPPAGAQGGSTARGATTAATAATAAGRGPVTGSIGGAFPSGNAPYQITVASFHTEQNASDVAAAVKALNVPAVVRTDSTGAWFIVVAGPFQSRDAAQKAQQQIEQGGFEKTQIAPVAGESR